jgi:hypothetical protein
VSWIIRANRETDRYGRPFCACAEIPPESTVWKHIVGRQLSEAREACVQGLNKIPTGLGRLAYLSILQHQLLDDHEELFGEFCRCSLQEKYDWLFRLLAAAIHDETLPDGWRKAGTYSDLIPRSARTAARERYLSDIEIALQILSKELHGAFHREGGMARRAAFGARATTTQKHYGSERGSSF